MTSKTSTDIGTKEIARRLKLKPELASQKGGLSVRMRVTDESLIDRLLLSEKISLTEHYIAIDLLRDLWKARFLSIPVPNFNSFGAHEPKDSSPAWSKAVEKLSAFFNKLDRDLGINAKNIVTRVLAHEIQPSPSEIETFRSSLVSYSLFADEWRQR